MSKYYIVHLIAISILLRALQGLTRPFNSCSDIVINNIQITNLPSSDFSSARTTTAPFATAQPDSSYQALASFQQFELSQAESKITINMYVSSKSTSSIDISFTGADSGGFITVMKVTYIIIPSVYSSEIQAFTVDSCLSFLCLLIRSQSSGNTASQTQTFPSALKAGTNQAFVFFNTVYLQTSNYPTNNFGQSIDISIINSTHFSLIYKNPSSVTMFIGYYVVSVIVYHVPSPTLGLTMLIKTIEKNSPSTTVTDTANTFFGLTQFSLVNGKMNFAVGSSGSSMTLSVGPQMLAAKVDLLTFTLGQCCVNTPYIDTVQSVCVDSCPVRTYLQSGSVNCLPCAYDCYTCTNNLTCSTCNSSVDKRQLNASNRCVPIPDYYESGVTLAAACTYPNCCGSSPIRNVAQTACVASCPVRTYLVNNTVGCLACAYDCYTCDNNSTCLTCNATTDYRQFNASTGRCDPMPNYYDPGITTAAACSYPNCCGSSPYIDTLQSTCVASCPARTYLQNNSISCLPCAYDCLTCNNNSTCLTCDNSTDKRQHNSSTSRCDPIRNYRESGTTVAVLCVYPNCCGDAPIIFTAQSSCEASCPVRRYLDNSTMDCLLCAYDCYNCTNNVTCNSCDNSTDKRQFNSSTNRCIPIHNYYDAGVTVAVMCSYPNCCGDTPIIFRAQSVCASSCPVRRYLDNSTMDCLPCVYDCYNCTNHINCTSCDNSTDHRQFDPATERCIPIYNYYDPGSTVAVPCVYPKCCGSLPIIYTAKSKCTNSCPVRTYLQVSIKDCFLCAYDCYTCSDGVNCLTCSNSDHRQYNPTLERCEPKINYYESGTKVAARCLYPNCCGSKPINFYQKSTCLSSCPKNYTYVPVTKTCTLCKAGYWPVSNICINIVGCTGAKLVNNKTTCLICDVTAHYTLSNNTCVCSEGYMFSNEAQACKEICGNGYHFDEKCDDGNLIDGDGCSSACTVQTHFRCESDSSSQPSKCLFVGSKIQFTLNYVNKTEGRNQGVFSFKASTQYVKLNLTKLFVSYNFTSEPTPTSLQVTTSQNEILLYADYDEDLQGNMAKLSLQLNQDYIDNIKQLSTTFSMSSVGSKLVVVKNYGTLATYSQVIQMLSYVVLGLFVVSSVAYKMIGVEILHSFLVIYLICLETSYQTDPYILFRSFKLINLNFIEQSSNFYSPATASNYQIQSQLLGKKILGVTLLLALCLCGILKMVIHFKYQKQVGQECMKKDRIATFIENILNWIYNIFFFPLAIGFVHFSLFPAFLASTSASNSQYFNSNSYLIVQLRIFLTVLCSLVFFYEFKPYFTDQNAQFSTIIKHDEQYESVYLLFWLQATLMFSVNCLYKFDWLQEYVLFLYLRFSFFWFLHHRPYQKAIHNFGQFINLTLVILFVGWSVGRKYFLMFQEEDNQILLVFVIILLMSLALMLTTARTILQLKENCKKSEKKMVKTTKRKRINKQVEIPVDNVQFLLEQENRYRLKHMLINKRLIDIRCLDVLKDHGQVKKEIMNEMKRMYLRLTNLED